ncbi:MAG: hypothetical protein J6Y02_06365 [Pseudobutyrivibrio sp.]|nr:hypothetical protein [Pseudobutyrivibrio sp.]
MFNTDDDLYFSWLECLVTPPRNRNIVCKNHLMLYILYTRQFLVNPSVPMDQNRLYDGLELRQRFIQETGKYRYKFLSDDCSIMEMLIALSLRIEETVSDEMQCGAYKWFWEMLNNLGIDRTPDKEFINHMLDIFINREYNYDGSDGGLFIISDPRKPLPSTELWYQAMWYVTKLYL